jgi:hypothetical protein
LSDKDDYTENGECFAPLLNQMPESIALSTITHHFISLTIMAKMGSSPFEAQ